MLILRYCVRESHGKKHNNISQCNCQNFIGFFLRVNYVNTM